MTVWFTVPSYSTEAFLTRIGPDTKQKPQSLKAVIALLSWQAAAVEFGSRLAVTSAPNSGMDKAGPQMKMMNILITVVAIFIAAAPLFASPTAQVPEPVSISLLGIGIAGLAGKKWMDDRRRK